jgi:hypothetical protein
MNAKKNCNDMVTFLRDKLKLRPENIKVFSDKKVVEDDSDEDLERMMASIKSECGIAKRSKGSTKVAHIVY